MIVHIHIPNLLTLFRVAIIPVLVVIYFLPLAHREVILTALFVTAALTDWLDGYLARRMDAVSPLGAFLDPVADKLVVSSALVLLVSDREVLDAVLHTIPFVVAVAIIIGREIVVSALREWMSELGERGAVAVGWAGKYKTAVQMTAISLLLYAEPLVDSRILLLGELLLYVAAGLTLWTMVEYLKSAAPYLREG